ncbi:hypothetical protein J3Q64DRAFT_1851234 [Phycomyces blakesleeanus]|uniref:MADF domain-containing protein n=1 Tax=Phycomyces blakesleeanus TaxID=4837 RepID=A0ABR3AQQ8_PHYBL
MNQVTFTFFLLILYIKHFLLESIMMREEHLSGYLVLEFDNTLNNNNNNNNRANNSNSTSVGELSVDNTGNITFPTLSHSEEENLVAGSASTTLGEPIITLSTSDVDSARSARGSHGRRSSRGGRGSCGRRGVDHGLDSVIDQDEAIAPTQASNQVNLSWDHQSIVILLNDIIKPNYMSLIDMSNMQLKGERWNQMAETFKRHLDQHGLDMALTGTGVGGGTGEERWLFYNYVFEILRDDPSENSGINVESMVRGRCHGVTISIESRAKAAITELQRNIEVAASTSAVELSLLNTLDTNIATATLNSTNTSGPSSRLPTRGT